MPCGIATESPVGASVISHELLWSECTLILKWPQDYFLSSCWAASTWKGKWKAFKGIFVIIIIIIFPVLWQQTLLSLFQTYPHRCKMKAIWDIVWNSKIHISESIFYLKKKIVLPQFQYRIGVYVVYRRFFSSSEVHGRNICQKQTFCKKIAPTLLTCGGDL